MIKRFHLFEFGDLEWFPNSLRNMATDFLEFGANKFDIYEPILPMGIECSKEHKILDIASGSGGRLVKLSEHLKNEFSDLKITLSDYYPNKKAFERTISKKSGIFNCIEFSIDAKNIPSFILGFRTMFLSFHHFKPNDAKAILQNAVETSQSIGIFEAQQRNIGSMIPMMLSPISLLLMTPSLGRLALSVYYSPICYP